MNGGGNGNGTFITFHQPSTPSTHTSSPCPPARPRPSPPGSACPVARPAALPRCRDYRTREHLPRRCHVGRRTSAPYTTRPQQARKPSLPRRRKGRTARPAAIPRTKEDAKRGCTLAAQSPEPARLKNKIPQNLALCVLRLGGLSLIRQSRRRIPFLFFLVA